MYICSVMKCGVKFCCLVCLSTFNARAPLYVISACACPFVVVVFQFVRLYIMPALLWKNRSYLLAHLLYMYELGGVERLTDPRLHS